MLFALRRHRAAVRTSPQPQTAIEYVWTVIPWLILALCVAPAVRRVLADG
jgi:heme/copper-type cytochrome/quinol oxidase subunit 2